MVANTTNGSQFIIDSEHKFLLNDTWHLSKSGYILRNKDLTKLHRVVIKAKKGEIVDHIDRNKLNNSISNLRIANHNENIHNQVKRKNTKNSYKGVKFIPESNTYESRCRMNGLDLHLGTYSCEISAGYAYNKKALELSSFACVNEFNLPEEYLEKILISHRRTYPISEKKSIYPNVFWGKKRGRMKFGKWETFIIIDKLKIHLGKFISDLDAYNTYKTALSLKTQFNGNKEDFRILVRKKLIT